MAEPFNYSLGIQSPLQAFQGALGLGQAVMGQQEARLAKEAAVKKQADLDAAYAKLFAPGATSKDFLSLASILPEESSKPIRESLQLMKQEEQQAALAETAQIFSAFKSNNPEIGIQLLRRQAEAERNSDNEQGAKFAETLASMAEESPDGALAITNFIGLNLAQMPGGDKAIEGALKYEADRRAALEFPDLLAKKKAEMEKAKSEAAKADIDAKYAERMKIADLMKNAADVGLTKEQRQTTEKLGLKYGADVAEANLKIERMQKGILDPETKFNQENVLRDEVTPILNRKMDTQSVLGKMQAAAKSKTGPGDIALVTMFMKMIDEGSVVREAEFESAKKSGGLMASLESIVTRNKDGTFVTPENRDKFFALASEFSDVAIKGMEKRIDGYKGIATRNSLSWENINPEGGAVHGHAPSAPAAFVPQVTGHAPAAPVAPVIKVDF